MLEDDEFMNANIFIAPPIDPACSDQESGDEEEMFNSINNLSRRQLEAEAKVTVHRGGEHSEFKLTIVLLKMLTSPRHHLWNQLILCKHRSMGIEADQLLESMPQTDQRTSPRHQHRHQLILYLHHSMAIMAD